MIRHRKLSFRQWSIRTALLGTLLAAIGFAYLARQDAKRRQLIADIEEVGGSVTFDESLFTLFRSARVSAVRLPHARVAEVGGSRLKSLDNLTQIQLTNVDTTTHDGLRVRAPELRIGTISDELLDGLESPIVSISTQIPPGTASLPLDGPTQPGTAAK